MLPGVHLAVRELEDFSLQYVYLGKMKREHLWTEVVHQKQGWATLLVGYREKTVGGWGPSCYKLIRLRRMNGLWRRRTTFNLKPAHLAGMMTATARAMGGAQ